MIFNKSVNPIEHAFHLLKAERPPNKQQLKTVTVKALLSILKEETSVGHWLQRICTQVLKIMLFKFFNF